MLCVFRSSWYIDQEDTLWVEASTTPITQYTWSSLVKRRRVGRTTEYWYLRYLSYRTYCYTCVTDFANDIASSAATMALVILSCSLPDRSVFGGRSGLMPFEGSLRPLVQQVEATRVADGLVISKSSTHTSTSGAAICFSNLQAFNVSQVIRSTSHNARLVCSSPPLQPSAAISTGQHCVKMVHHYHNVLPQRKGHISVLPSSTQHAAFTWFSLCYISIDTEVWTQRLSIRTFQSPSCFILIW